MNFLKKPRTRTRGGQAADTRVHRSDCNYRSRYTNNGMPEPKNPKSKKLVAESLTTDFCYITAEKRENRKQPEIKSVEEVYFYNYCNRNQTIPLRVLGAEFYPFCKFILHRKTPNLSLGFWHSVTEFP